MSDNAKRYYFPGIKLLCMIMLIIYYISSSEKSLQVISLEWFLLAAIMAALLCYELMNSEDAHTLYHIAKRKGFRNWIAIRNNQYKLIFLSTEIILTLVLIIFFRESNNGLILLPFIVLDTVVCFHLSFVVGLFAFFGVLLRPDHFFLYLGYCFFVMITYYQNFMIVEKYRSYLRDFEQQEYKLKDSIEIQDTVHKEELEKSSLAFENKMLEEKTRLSQALHDKLGHSINGSIYQLEACKVLMKEAPEESTKMMQAVIDNLRSSMDEIRSILRKEKPDKKRMAYLQLVQLCSDCKEKYGITAEVKMEGENKDIPEAVWDVILDNSVEAVTNALKYAQCTRILVEIILLHKVIRCSIEDNGTGCEAFKEGMGIQGMKNRIRKVNGIIDINSEVGFHINMIIPL